MGTFGITKARQKLGFTPSTAVRANIDVRGQGGVGPAIAQGAIKLFQQYDIQQSNIKFSEFQNLANDEMNNLAIRRKGNLDPDTYQKDLDDTVARIRQNIPKRRRSSRAANIWLNGQTPRWQLDSINAQMARSDDNWDTEISLKIAGLGSDPSLGNLQETEKFIARRQLGPTPLDKSKAAKLLTEARAAQVEGQVATLKQMGVAGDLGKFDEARELVQSSGAVFTSEETLAELRSIEMMKRFTASKTKDLAAVRNLAINEDFLPQIIDKTLTPDDIQISRLPDKAGFGELSKNDWMFFADASYGPPPESTTPAGLNGALKTVIDFGKRRIAKESAYKELLTLRYSDKSITDTDFNSAVKRIQNPYPPQVTADIDAITQDNIKSIEGRGFLGGFIVTDKEEAKARDVNSDLLQWIDSQIEAGKEPTRQDMYQKSAELIAQTITPIKDDKKKGALTELSDQELLKRITK